MIPNKHVPNPFPVFAKPASAGEARSDKIIRQEKI